MAARLLAGLTAWLPVCLGWLAARVAPWHDWPAVLGGWMAAWLQWPARADLVPRPTDAPRVAADASFDPGDGTSWEDGEETQTHTTHATHGGKGRQREREREREPETETDRQTDRQRYRDRLTDILTDRVADRLTD